MSESPLDRFMVLLAMRNRQLAPELSYVANVVFGLDAPFDADTVVEGIHCDTGMVVSRKTIYYTISLMERAGLITAESDGRYVHSVETFDMVMAMKSLLGSRVFRTVTPMCKATHTDLIAGTCPWCGGMVFNGKVR